MPVLTAGQAPVHELGTTRFTSLATPSRGTTDTAVWVTEIAAGTPATVHRVTREEVFVVLEGSAEVRVEGVPSVAGTGDAIVVDADEEFSITASGAAGVRLLCVLPVGGQAVHGGRTFTPPWAR